MHTDRKISDEYELKTSNSLLNEHLVRLKKTYRYESNSKMGRFTKAVIDGHQNQLESIASMDEESLKIDVDYKDAIFIDFIKKYTMYICEPDIKIALEKFNDCRVLCAVRQSDKGVYKINEKIVNYLKKYSKEHQLNFIPSTDFYENQPIMVTKNLDALNLFNGDVGIIRKSRWHNNRLMAFFPIGNETDYGAIKDIDIKAINPGFISDWELVFAMTIHKSQGSEFKDVLVILPNKEENKLLTRELLYTAITRAKKGGVAIIQATMNIIYKTTSQKVDRVSGIVERIQLPK